MNNAKLLVLLLASLLAVAQAIAVLVPDEGISYYNFSSVADQWADNDLTNYGTTSVSSYPTFHIAGTSGPNCSDFDGSSDYLSRASTSWGIGNEWTVSMWIRPESLTGLKYLFMLYNSTSWDNAIIIASGLNSYDYNVGFQIYDNDGSNRKFMIGNTSLSTGTWYHVALTWDGWLPVLYINGEEEDLIIDDNYSVMQTDQNRVLYVGRSQSAQYYFDGQMDEVQIYDESLSSAEILSLYDYGVFSDELTISNINCTSSGDATEPYTTYETTPVFTLETSVVAYCRIDDDNLSYNEMGSSRDCQSAGDVNHTCTLSVEDELYQPDQQVYISCRNKYYASLNTTVSLQMNITGLIGNSSLGIQKGIEDSVIYPGATIYADQQVYLRDANQQVTGRVDAIASYGNQRWLFNYIEENESALGLFNMTPVVYSLEMSNLTKTEIKNAVRDFIDATKN